MLCPTCNTEKERKHFKRLATLAQSRAWTGNPFSTKRIAYTGKECNECHKQTKRKPSDLTPNELHRRLTNEGKNPLVVQAQVAKRRAQGSKKKSAVTSRIMRAWWQTKKKGEPDD